MQSIAPSPQAVFERSLISLQRPNHRASRSSDRTCEAHDGQLAAASEVGRQISLGANVLTFLESQLDRPRRRERKPARVVPS